MSQTELLLTQSVAMMSTLSYYWSSLSPWLPTLSYYWTSLSPWLSKLSNYCTGPVCHHDCPCPHWATTVAMMSAQSYYLLDNLLLWCLSWATNGPVCHHDCPHWATILVQPVAMMSTLSYYWSSLSTWLPSLSYYWATTGPVCHHDCPHWATTGPVCHHNCPHLATTELLLVQSVTMTALTELLLSYYWSSLSPWLPSLSYYWSSLSPWLSTLSYYWATSGPAWAPWCPHWAFTWTTCCFDVRTELLLVQSVAMMSTLSFCMDTCCLDVHTELQHGQLVALMSTNEQLLVQSATIMSKLNYYWSSLSPWCPHWASAWTLCALISTLSFNWTTCCFDVHNELLLVQSATIMSKLNYYWSSLSPWLSTLSYYWTTGWMSKLS